MDCIVHGVAKSQTSLSDFHFHLTNNILLTRCYTHIFQGSKQTVVKGVDLFKILKRLKP